MTHIARSIAVASLSLMLTITAVAGSAAAQTQLFEVEKGDAKLLQVGDDAGFVVKGTSGTGTIPAAGAGVRLMWYPKQGALRAGSVTGDQWDDGNIGGFSVALGSNTIANGGNSTALGTQTTASGGNSTALGVETTASGPASTSLGRGTTASGEASTATGNRTTASGFGSTATGNSTTASGHSATAMGIATVASGGYATAMGDGSQATGSASTAMGGGTMASGIRSTAMGYLTVATGDASVAMGTRAIAQGHGSFAFADHSSDATYTAGANQFVVRAHGGIGFNSGTNIGCDLPAGVGAWACTSSRLAKEGFEDMDGEAVLAKLASIPIQRWYYLGTPAAHVGPTAEDFYAAFGLGEGSTTITTVDADGIALLGVQTLERRTADLRAENAELRAENAELRTGHAAILRRLEALESERTAATRTSTKLSIP